MNVQIDSRAVFSGDPQDVEQYIIAGGDEDMTANQMLEWIMPMLHGMPGHRWATCELEFEGEEFFARYRNSHSRVRYNYFDNWTKDELALCRLLLPASTALAIIAIGSYSSQVFTLIDSVASWLGMFDPGRPEMRPIRRLMLTFEDMARIGG